MKPERHFLSRSAQVFKRPFDRNENRAFVKSKCPACGQIVETITDPLPEHDQAVIAFPTPVSGKFDGKHPSNAADLEKVLHFSQQLYAHALTLQELIRNEGEVTYEVLRPRYDRQAAQQFEIFYRALERPSGFRKPAGSCK